MLWTLTRAWSRRGNPRGSGPPCVPGLAQSSRGGSPRARYERSRRRGAGPGRHREVTSGGSPTPHVRGDAQAPERRGGTPGTRGHVPPKSSIRAVGVLDTSGVDARTARGLTLGDRPGVQVHRGRRAARSALTERQQSAAGRGGAPPATLVRHPKAERRGTRAAEPPRGGAAGPHGAPRGACRRGGGAACRAGARQP